MKSNYKRILLFDALKSISGLLMTIYHCSLYQQYNYKYYIKRNLKYQYFINCCYVSLTRTCSRLFMMVTGCLLLSPKRLYDKPSIHRNYYFKRLREYLFWIFPFFYDEFRTYDWINNGKKSVINIIFRITDGGKMFWYIKILLIIHLITPAIQSSLRNIKRKEVEVLLILYFFSLFVVNNERIFNKKNVSVYSFDTLFFSFILGPYLFQSSEYSINPSSSYVSEWIKGDSLFPLLNKIDVTKKKERKILFIITLYTILYGGFFDYFYQRYRILNGLVYIGLGGIYNVILTSFVFLLLFSCFRNWKPSSKFEMILSNFFYSSGSCSMGIYMTNEIFIYRIMNKRVFPFLHLDWYGMNTFFFGPMMGFFSFIICWRLSLLIKKIPILKQTIF